LSGLYYPSSGLPRWARRLPAEVTRRPVALLALGSLSELVNPELGCVQNMRIILLKRFSLSLSLTTCPCPTIPVPVLSCPVSVSVPVSVSILHTHLR
jgi:hypothetical protein